MDRKQNKISEAEEDDTSPKNKQKNRGKKRKRVTSDSSTDIEDILPENTLEIEKNLHASAVKNNLDDASVKKILKKVVTNDHVLALVKLREEEEESSTEEGKHVPKLTRAKVKELKKVSTGNTAWNLENLELTPIKHIPVKTRPEVKALIAQELPEDEDDDEYEPEDVPSDDDQTLESCSDLDSLPRTPATPKLTRSSPKIVKDGPFIVPQELTPTVKRKLELDKEEATIALRTRSKLSLSETPIEHIESSFVPPDDLPVPAVDDLWNEFLVECLNPAPSSKHEDDDETDPEYNVAADPDAPDDEDEEALEKSIVKISKKELNDLMTELFSIMPEVGGAGGEGGAQDISDNAQAAPAQTPQTEVSGHWEGKQETLSDDENTPRKRLSDSIIFERRNSNTRFSIGKSESEDKPEGLENLEQTETTKETATTASTTTSTAVVEAVAVAGPAILIRPLNVVNIALEEKVVYVDSSPPKEPVQPSILCHINTNKKQEHQLNRRVELHITEGPCILPEQTLILQQQLRQHVQLATSNFLQLFVHPIHWALAPTFKEFLETLTTLTKSRPDSVAKVCNLQPALELVLSWEKSLSRDTPENAEYVQFVQRDADRGRRCSLNNNLYVGNFHNTFMDVVANSTVFLYPHLLPPLPYRSDGVRRQTYVRPEDELIAIGLDQFWSYVEKNPKLFPPPVKPHPRYRWGFNTTVELVAKYMFPFLKWKALYTHIQHVRRRDKENPITVFLTNRTLKSVQHEILAFDPKKTLYDQPEDQIPYIWLRYLSKTSKLRRFKNHRRSGVLAQTPSGVPLKVAVAETKKPPLPSHFTKKIVCNRASKKSQPESSKTTEPTLLPPVMARNLFTLQQTSNGPCLVPLTVTTKTLNSTTSDDTTKTVDTIQITSTNTVNCTQTPISSIKTAQTPFLTIQPIAQRNNMEIVHCKCCVILQRIRKNCPRQSHITDYFNKKVKRKKFCYCNEVTFPRITNRLRLLVAMHKDPWVYGMETLKSRLIMAEKEAKLDVLIKNRQKIKKEVPVKEETPISLDDLVFVILFRSKVATRSTGNIMKKINSLFVNFDLDSGDPAYLAEALFNTCKDDQIGLFHDFIGFLTPEQAARCGKFTDYFIQTCLVDLVKTIENQIKENDRREATFRQLNKAITYGTPTACDICTALLPTLNKYPELALQVFSLFPHRTTKDNDRNVNNIISVKTTNNDDQQEVLKENEMQISACEGCSSEQYETQVKEREVHVENKNKAQAIKQTKAQVEKQKKVLKPTRQQVKKQKNAEIIELSEEETESEDDIEEYQNGEQVEIKNKVQTRKQYKAQVEKQKEVLKLTRARVKMLNKAQIKEQNGEQMERQNEKEIENIYKSPERKRTKAQIEKHQIVKQTRARQRKQNEVQIEVNNDIEINELEEQKEELMDIEEEEQMTLQNEKIKHQNKEEIKQNKEQMEYHIERCIEQQNEEKMDQHNKEQVEQQNEEVMEMQGDQQKKVKDGIKIVIENEKQMKGENERQMELQNEIRLELENEKQIGLENEKQTKLDNEKEMELDNEKQMELDNEIQMELDNEKQMELDNVKQVDLQSEKQTELQNGKQMRLDNKKQMELYNEKQTELDNEQMELDNEKQIVLDNEKQMELDNEKQMVLDNEKQMELQNGKQITLDNEKQMELQNEKQTELRNEKEMGLDNEKQTELQNEKEMGLDNEKQTELQNEKEMGLDNEKQTELQNEKEMGLDNETQMELDIEKQMEVQNEKQIGLDNAKQIESQYEKQMELQKENKIELQHEAQQHSEEQEGKQKQYHIKVQYPERIEEAVNDATQTAVDYEADHSSSGEDENDAESGHERDNKETELKEKGSVPSPITKLDTHTITIIKTESQDYSEDSDESMVIASDEETTIYEGPVWSRDEDKIILESLKDHLTPEERMDKTILEILEEERVFETLTDTLLHKSVKDIRDRVVYLLKMLLLSKK